MTALAEDWGARRSPSLAEIEGLAERAFHALPELFRRACEGLVILVADFPDEETLTEMGCDPFDLLGLFRGIGLAQSGVGSLGTGQMPNEIWLYRRPLLDHWAQQDDTLGQIVTHVLVHEIGHHMGLSDEDMEALERKAE